MEPGGWREEQGREVTLQTQGRLGAGGTAVGLHSQRAFSCMGTLCKEPASLFWPWLWLCAYSGNRPRRPLRALACEAEADPAQQHLDSGTGEGCRAAWAPARVEAQLEANPAGSSGAGLHRVCPRGRVLALYPSTRRPTAVQAPRQAPPGAQRSSGVKKHWKQSTQKPGRVPQTGRWETGHHGGKGTAASTWDFTLGFVLPHALHLLYQHS